ncbi:cation transporter [Mollicutes bacterium LVI A0039]|nr:cation transporter [Mollicutes bacterium LVI A0039]
MTHERVLKRNLIFIFIMALSGLVFGLLTGSKSIITDGIVSTVIFISSSIGIFIHSSIEPLSTRNYPYGKWRFEYVYNLLRLITLLAIIGYSFLDSIYVIFHYIVSDIVPKEVVFSQILPYFIIKIIAVFFSLAWLRKNFNRGNIAEEVFSMEKSSVMVDGLLTVAIFLGIVVFSQIDAISEIADALTLLVVAVILAVSIFQELHHLVDIMIGKRVFLDEEQFIKDLIQLKYSDMHIKDVYLEKHGLISMIYIQCFFDTPLSTQDLIKLERELKSYLKIHKIEKPRLHFFFDDDFADDDQ